MNNDARLLRLLGDKIVASAARSALYQALNEIRLHRDEPLSSGKDRYLLDILDVDSRIEIESLLRKTVRDTVCRILELLLSEYSSDEADPLGKVYLTIDDGYDSEVHFAQLIKHSGMGSQEMVNWVGDLLK